MKPIKLLLYLTIVAALAACNQGKAGIRITGIKIENLDRPLGIDIAKPGISWQIESAENNIRQTAYQILVADSPEKLNRSRNLFWDSGKREGWQSIDVRYEGPALQSNTDYWIRIKVWTNKGEAQAGRSTWSTAFLGQEEWKGTWIGLDSLTNPGDSLGNQTRLSARYLRKTFGVEKEIKRARLYISGLGLYECYLNGHRISNDVLSPGYTDYSVRVNYNVYDVRQFLSKGENTIGTVLGNGRFVPIQTWRFRNYGFPKLLIRLDMEYTDGTLQSVTGDETWKITAHGPIVSNNEYDGEEFNTNLDLGGWNTNGYDDSSWMNARKVAPPGGKLQSQPNPNITVMEEIKPVAITEPKPGCYVLDMGQNMVGWLRVSLNGTRNQQVRLRYSERIYEDGNVNTENLRVAKSQGIYIPSGDGPFTWEPSFTYHGFRYVEITGVAVKPDLNGCLGRVIYDRMETTGSFACSNPVITRIHRNAYWGIRGNYRNGPTDCPQRDEKLFWLGDRSMNCFGESFIFDNHLLYSKWVQDMEDNQLQSGCLPDIAPYHSSYNPSQETFGSDNVTWPSTFIFATNMVYEQFGDPEPVIRHYNSMTRWIDYMTTRYLKDNILVKDQYGDWCVPPESRELILTKDPARKTDGAILSTAVFYRVLQLMARFSVISGHPGDQEAYLFRAAAIKKAYNDKFFDKSTARYGNSTVTANILSLAFGLVPEGFERRVMQNIREKILVENSGHISTGVVGTQYLMRGLTKFGSTDLAYRIATNTTYPSWGYMTENGATTIWELWNGNTADPGMNSHNHVMLLGDLIIWMYENLAGIRSDPENPGFRRVLMNPVFVEGLDSVSAFHKSRYGVICSKWKKTSEGLVWDISIPCNTTALVSLPAAPAGQLTINGIKAEAVEGSRINGTKEGRMEIELGSGKYRVKTGI